jgi:hypothetical protein
MGDDYNGLPVDEVYGHLADYTAKHYDKNEGVIDSLLRAVQASIVCFAAEIVLWVILLAGR